MIYGGNKRDIWGTGCETDLSYADPARLRRLHRLCRLTFDNCRSLAINGRLDRRRKNLSSIVSGLRGAALFLSHREIPSLRLRETPFRLRRLFLEAFLLRLVLHVFVLHFFFLHHHLLLLRCTPLSESVLDGRACRNEHRALVGTAERS